jgi:hypothetical protein
MRNSGDRIEDLWLDIIKYNRKYVVAGVYRHLNQSIENFKNSLGTVLA